MTERMQPIIRHLFQADSLEDVSRERLEAFVEQYPSFGIGHYLLSRKLRGADEGPYLEKTGRTSLYFTNPLWLQWLLESQPVTRQVVMEPVVGPPAEPLRPVEVAEPIHPLEAAEPGVEDELRQAEVMPEPVVHENTEPIRDEEVPFVLDEPEEVVPEEALEEEAMHDMEEDAVKHGGHLDPAWTGHPEEPVVERSKEAEEPVRNEEPIRDEEPPFVLEEPVERTAAAKTEERPGETGTVTPEGVAAPVLAVAAPTTEPLVFEPYHTIDYFASQGIKLNLDEISTTDKLGKQMKSFTEWLKTMRRVPQKERETAPDPTADRNIQTIAAHSIEGKEIVTEAMAEVWIKQGMREKAREVYQKLSLLNPDKRAYFASKIEQLNIH